jgi:putative intracellular protease/amidase
MSSRVAVLAVDGCQSLDVTGPLEVLHAAGGYRIDVVTPGGAGEMITTSEIEHISPLAHQHIHLYGHYPFDLASRPDGHRPLRTPAAPSTRSPETLNRV